MEFLYRNIHMLALLFALLWPSDGVAQVRITELMQSNIDCIMDDINEFPDSWVEIYNGGGSSVVLSDFSIGLTENPDEAWTLPNERLNPGQYRLIYCDKEAKKYHTDFRLDSGKGGSVYLFNKKQIEDKVVDIPKQPTPNIAYGRVDEKSEQWGYQKTPTPGFKNCGIICDKILGEPVFSISGRVFDTTGSYTVEITLPEDAPEGTVIRYTVDGSEPTEKSIPYKNPFRETVSRVIRAKLFCDGYLSAQSTTHSYIIHPREVTLPVVSIVTKRDYFYDDKMGIYVNGTYSSGTKNYQYNWRRPANVEYFNAPGQESQLNQLCELRCAGAASRGCVLKSLALYANKRFGKKHFSYEFFPEDRPGQTDYKSIVIRNAGNDFDYLYMRDAVIQRSVAHHVDMDYQEWQPAIFYLNGKYMGMLNIRERGNESNIYTNYNHLEDVDVVENWNSLKEGTMENLDAFKAFYNEHGHTLDEYRQWLDIDEFINYMAMNMYYNNVDFPSNNLMMWRPRTENGRWRFIAKDVDYALGIYDGVYNYQYISWFYNNTFDSGLSWGNTYDATRLFRRLMEIDEFKQLFLDRMAIYMGSFLNYDHIWKEIWEPMYEKIKTEYPYHREPINKWWPNYADELRKAQQWMKNRTAFFYSHMSEYYQTGTMAQLVVNNQISEDDKNAIDYTFNDIPLCGGSFDGWYFPGHEITLKGISEGEKTVTAWSVLRIDTTGKPVNDEVKGNVYSMNMPPCTRLQINAIIGDAEGSGIESVGDDVFAIDQAVEIYDANGIRHAALQPGLNIVKLKNGAVRKIQY